MRASILLLCSSNIRVFREPDRYGLAQVINLSCIFLSRKEGLCDSRWRFFFFLILFRRTQENTMLTNSTLLRLLTALALFIWCLLYFFTIFELQYLHD